MPQDRLRSPRAGHGRKTSSLSHLEYRVWDQYQLSADDFGVMRFSAITIQDGNDALSECLSDEIVRALDKIVDVGLAIRFEHQGKRFICDPTWQQFQKVEYPRVTLLPKPLPEVLQQCNAPTRKLFLKHPGGSSNKPTKNSRRFSEDSPSTRARVTRETANGKRLTANGNKATEFDAFWKRYPNGKSKHAALKAWQRLRPEPSVVTAIHAALDWQTRDQNWVKDRGQYVPMASTYLNQRRWEDEGPKVTVRPPPGEWTVECKRLHGGRCTNVGFHSAKMAEEQATEEPR